MSREEFLKNAYESINDDSRFAETKNTFLLTFNSAVLGLIVAFLTSDKSLSCFGKIMVIIFSAIVFVATICSLISFFPVSPLRKGYNKYLIKNKKSNEPKFMFYRYISSNFNIDDKDNVTKLGEIINKKLGIANDYSGIEIQYLNQIIDLSCIASLKFFLFKLALYFEIISLVFFIPFFISIL